MWIIVKSMIHIVNKKFYKGTCEYIGRPSILGNPYTHKVNTIAKYRVKTIDEAIALYNDWIFDNLGDKAIANELNRLADIAEKGDLILGCWCVPFSDCHGFIIKYLIELILEDRKNERMATDSSSTKEN